MNPTSLYVSVSRLVFQTDSLEQNWTDLFRLIPYLRQSLSCCVCGNLLMEPYSPDSPCQHHECKTCIGGRKNLKPSCSWCREYQKYEENVQLRILLQCYKSLCEHIKSSGIYQVMMKQVQSSVKMNGTGAGASLVDIIDEGVMFKDNFKSTAGLSKSAYSILPCLYTSIPVSSSAREPAKVAERVSVGPSTVTTALSVPRPQPIAPPMQPAIKTVSNGSAMYSVLYAGNGNKITIKRKTAEPTPAPPPQPPDPQIPAKATLPCFKKPFQATTKAAAAAAKAAAKRKGCRCGNATATPGKLTCCGQRCPCYVESKACLDCKCRGCRNPHRPDGFKVRPRIPELENLELSLDAASAMPDFGGQAAEPFHQMEQECSMVDQHITLDHSPPSPVVFTSTSLQVLNVYSGSLSPASTTVPAILMSETPATSSTSSSSTSSSYALKDNYGLLNAVFAEEIVDSQDSLLTDDDSREQASDEDELEQSDMEIDI
ncbi:E3 ubiquitin-protein ligase MSL2 isoform X2 [Phlebotomus argentipes]|uniref:E3 ubiquitin-protein ligase MSL2 isoform X2 n=1 Tax=Phlebotomus argentipes TaxID=94469 RepID=UPI002892D062|nr:E3 ubiquitin-protein ligase MSL2 isoform X2 [Phlebotomus argentipes]